SGLDLFAGWNYLEKLNRMVQRFAAQSAVNPGVPSGYPLAYADNPSLYIHARNPFVISLYLYIQNRKPFVMNKSWHMPKEGGFRWPEPGATDVPVCIYTRGSPLLSAY